MLRDKRVDLSARVPTRARGLARRHRNCASLAGLRRLGGRQFLLVEEALDIQA